jgi:hypothetical protein
MNGIIIEWLVVQLALPSYPQNRSSLPKLVQAEFHGLGTHEEFMETDGNSIRQRETVIEAAKNYFRLGVVDAALWHFTSNLLFKTMDFSWNSASTDFGSELVFCGEKGEDN